jgi:hypothetical protein
MSSHVPGAIIHGLPITVAAIEDYLDNFGAILNQAIIDAQVSARRSLQEAAQALPGWKDIAEHLDVEFDGQNFNFVVTDAEAAKVATRLEYGDGPNSNPTALLRKQAIKQGAVLGMQIGTRLSSEVPHA